VTPVPFAQLKNARIHYDLAGPAKAPVLVLSNSLGTDFSMWDAQMATFQKHLRVLRYDTRGHGKSDVTPGPYSIEQLGRDVVGLLDELRLERVHFCGLSMGGMIGIWLALNAPQRMDKLILCNTAAKIGTPEVWKARIDAVRAGGMQSISGAVMERWFTAAFRAKSPEIVATIQRMVEKTNPEGYAANCAAVRDFDERERVASIRVSTLVICGTHDPSTTPADARFLSERIAGARLAELEAAHLSNIEDQEQFTAEVSAFLPV
jgi:3-oxoadipate enol-lactonase